MSFTATPGETLLLPIPTSANKHLFIVVAGIEPHTNNVIIVGLQTERPGCDTTVILRPGNHPFITHATSVRYKDARIISSVDLIRYVQNGLAEPKDPCSPELLTKIREGLSRSRFTSFEVKEMYQKLTWPIA